MMEEKVRSWEGDVWDTRLVYDNPFPMYRPDGLDRCHRGGGLVVYLVVVISAALGAAGGIAGRRSAAKIVGA
jgi:hypothetical protein